jgi:hypothetical protein
MLVLISDTVVDEDAVVIEFGNAIFANATVLGPCWFQQLTGSACLTWVEDRVIVRIEA